MQHNISGIQHIGIPTNDIQLSIDFYKKIGFELTYSKVLDNGVKACFMNLGSVCIVVYRVRHGFRRCNKSYCPKC